MMLRTGVGGGGALAPLLFLVATALANGAAARDLRGAEESLWQQDDGIEELNKEAESRLLRVLWLRMLQEQEEEDGGQVPPEVFLDDDTEHPSDDKRNYRSLAPTLCHFKICNMGRKRNMQDGAAPPGPWGQL